MRRVLGGRWQVGEMEAAMEAAMGIGEIAGERKDEFLSEEAPETYE